MRSFLDGLGALFWSAFMLLVVLAIAVVTLRVARNRIPAASGAVNFTANATGLGI